MNPLQDLIEQGESLPQIVTSQVLKDAKIDSNGFYKDNSFDKYNEQQLNTLLDQAFEQEKQARTILTRALVDIKLIEDALAKKQIEEEEEEE